jgi:rhodanese-related sulfurtransferase
MKQITASELDNELKNGKSLQIIDVREVSEVAAGKIPGAINIPLGLLEFRMNELNKSEDYIIVCHSGGRSAMATQFLEQFGYKVTNMTGGMMAWTGDIE